MMESTITNKSNDFSNLDINQLSIMSQYSIESQKVEAFLSMIYSKPKYKNYLEWIDQCLEDDTCIEIYDISGKLKYGNSRYKKLVSFGIETREFNFKKFFYRKDDNINSKIEEAIKNIISQNIFTPFNLSEIIPEHKVYERKDFGKVFNMKLISALTTFDDSNKINGFIVLSKLNLSQD